MQSLKNTAAFLLIILISGAASRYSNLNSIAWILLPFVFVCFFFFNIVTRKSLSFKNYFTSRYNLFTTKVKYEKSFDISKGLLFEKIIEVINDSKFQLIEADKIKQEVLAFSPLSRWSWGENLYISFESRGTETIMKFCSATFFQIYAWGKNEKNYTDLLDQIEDSLIV